MLLNLIDNGVKYTPPGGSITVTAAASREDRMIHVEVADTGPGVPDEVGQRIFEPFFRVKDTKAQPGRASSGLGLALTRRLVEAHGGAITFRRRRAGGTAFTFTLPPSADPLSKRPGRQDAQPSLSQ